MASGEDIESFMGITGANRTAAERMLELCGSELEQAIQLWFSDEDLQRSLSTAGSSTMAAGAGTTSAGWSSRPNRPQVGREDAQGVIHIDSDDDVPMTEDENDDADEAANIARQAQEEEDAAMAKKLQEELYSGGASGQAAGAAEDAVRAPMARTTETLVGGSYDDDDDGHAAMLEQMRRRQQTRARPNPFAQSVWEDNARASRPASLGTAEPTRASRLAELFRPPYDLMSQLSWDEARDEGKDSKKWILVNLQDMSDFNCQALNRDIWKDAAVRSLVQENFIFLQYEKNEFSAQQYITFYFPNEGHQNPNNYPHVSIIDPRTGEQVKVWSGIPFPSALEFHAQLAEFLDRYSLSAHSKNPVPKTKRPERVVDVDRMTEEEMLEMALQNSLDANGSGNQPNIQDPDELTKSTGALAGDKGKGTAAPEATEPEASSAQESAFARIPSDQPHVEPPADPKTTTRLQVRNPPGRIIRRFRLDDRVSRIYEWLKAEPVPGKEGVEFELKSMPQGADLIEHLDETIQEAGLANGTVMLEFIEE
ncbi:hypothetical protein NEMBOFW57_002810 [Staphylotrichum longicolle]|uniref:UBX domain-containing protein n=1 Tax=Staphylotrichum longicolle TaxID=669026 RepID=A0AAD4F464_9PEZI|nr:hypothetical protein NEMBOFW57_002810 [Staphylotrichum longicolle]